MHRLGWVARLAAAAAICAVRPVDGAAQRPGRSVALAEARAAYDAARRGVEDCGGFVRIQYPEGGFPLARNTEGGVDTSWNGSWRSQPGKCRTSKQKAFVVPAALYCAARLVVSVDPSPALDRVFTVRITRYVDGPGYAGRDFAGMMNVEVDFDRAERRRIADGRWEVDVALDMGDVYDLVWNDDHGTWLNNRMRGGLPKVLDVPPYLDFEVMGRLVRRRSPMLDSRMQPDERYRSAVTVHSVELEKAGAEMKPGWIAPGNIFEAGERAETRVEVLVRRPGKYELEWEIRDAEGVRTGGGRRVFTPDSEEMIDLSQSRLGWYSLTYVLSEKGRRLATHHASFALLAADTRREGVGEGPYGTGSYGGNHYCSDDIDFLGPILRKAGFRRASGMARYPAERRHRYLLSPQAVLWDRRAKRTEAERVAEIAKSLADDPNCRLFTLLHEDAPCGHQQAWELTGQPVPDPREYGKAGWKSSGKRTAEEELAARRKRLEFAVEVAGIVRRNFPQVYITVGNSLASTELVAELVRDGFPESLADYMGVETVVRTQMPEREGDVGMQMADAFLQTAQALGCGKWRPNASWESCYRIDSLLGADRQAAWYVRDLLLEQAWRFRDVFIGNIMDCGNAYGGSFWGTSGLCGRAPYAYPKKSYVGVAVATRLLDRVTSARALPTGDGCVYAVEYGRRDGKRVCALWTSRGEATLEFDKGTDHVEFVDFYGRKLSPSGSRITACEFVRYAVAEGTPLKSVRVEGRDFREWGAVRHGGSRVAGTESLSEWSLRDGRTAVLENATGPFMPYRTKGEYELREAMDDERGRCLEIELVHPDLSLPTVMGEYCVALLKKPVPLSGDAHTLGAMVKGNSGWGRFFFVVEDSAKRLFYSIGAGSGDTFDYEGQVSMCYTGWNYVEMPLASASPVVNLTTGTTGILWRGGTMKPPNKIAGFGFVAQSRPLYLAERRLTRQAVRVCGLYQASGRTGE